MMNFHSGAPLLQEVRSTLIRLEDTVIYGLIERAQFARNARVYAPALETDGIAVPEWNRSFLEYILLKTEQLHASVRRYTSPDEYPFSPPELLPEPVLPLMQYPGGLLHEGAARNVNVSDAILKSYVEQVVPTICPGDGDDGNYGSAVVCDVHLLQALSRRIYLGLFVAEAKFRTPAARPRYEALIRAHDAAGLLAELTDAGVENALLRRVALKTTVYASDAGQWHEGPDGVVVPGPDAGSAAERARLAPASVSALYRDLVIPMTKKVQVEYLLRRLPAEHQ